MSPESYRDRLYLNFLATVVWLGCSLLIVLPNSILLANSGDFTLGSAEFFSFAVPLFLLCILVAGAIFSILPITIRPRIVAILFAFSALVWAQGNILVWDYGPLDGRTISWSEHRPNGYIDSVIWLSVLTLSLVAPRFFVKVALPFSCIIVAISLISLGVTHIQRPDNSNIASIKQFRIDDSNKFFFSSEKNVILIVLDALQSDVFAEVIEGPAYRRVFDGFIYFPDALGASNFTQLAIPTLLTGKYYDNAEPRKDFLRASFLEFGVTSNLSRADFIAEIYPWVGWGNETIYFDESVASNLKRKIVTNSQNNAYSEKNAKEVLHLIDLTLFRSVPHFLKKYIYNDQHWFTIRIAAAIVPRSMKQTISTDDEYETNVFVRKAVDQMAVGSAQFRFKYYHLKGTHTPLSVDSDLSFSNKYFPLTRQNYVASVKANVNSIGQFMDALKAENVFDKSLIVIVGDHGTGISPDLYVNPGEHGENIAGTKRNFQDDKARGIPLVLIKRIGAVGPLTVSQVPVSLSDIPATILAEVGVDGPAVGRSVFDMSPGETRARIFGAFTYRATHSDYVGPLTIYEVRGNSWHDSSWSVKAVQYPIGVENTDMSETSN